MYLVPNVQNQHHMGVTRPDVSPFNIQERSGSTQRAQFIPNPAMYSGYRKKSNWPFSHCHGSRWWPFSAFVEDLSKTTHSSFPRNSDYQTQSNTFVFPSYSVFSLTIRMQTSRLQFYLAAEIKMWSQTSKLSSQHLFHGMRKAMGKKKEKKN